MTIILEFEGTMDQTLHLDLAATSWFVKNPALSQRCTSMDMKFTKSYIKPL